MTTARIEDNGFAELSVSSGEVQSLLSMMKARIRRISHLEHAGPSEFAEVSRLAHLCYTITSGDQSGRVVLTRLSREDIDSIYVLPIQDQATGVLQALNGVRAAVRSGGPCDPAMADRMVKSLVEVIED